MVATRAQKRSVKESLNPLHQAGILRHVLDFVGPGHWRFVAEVSSLWRDVYKRVSSREISDPNWDVQVTCVPEMTLYSSVFASPSRLRLAHDGGLSSTQMRYRFAASKYADVATLEVAHELGMDYTPGWLVAAIDLEGAVYCNELAVVQFLHDRCCYWTNHVFSIAAQRGDMDLCEYLYASDCGWSMGTCEAAARSGHADILRWLREHDCPWDEDRMHTGAAKGGSVDVMVYLQEEDIVFDAEILTEMLKIAGACNKLAAAQWLRKQGAQWPAVLKWQKSYRDQLVWSDDALAWARAEGCTSPTE
jgi:hypothetical protein